MGGGFGGNYQSAESYNKDLEAEIGRLYMKNRNLEFALKQCEKWRNEDFFKFSETEKERMAALEKTQKLCESLQKDLDKALSLADLSKQGADTPNPFDAWKHVPVAADSLLRNIDNNQNR